MPPYWRTSTASMLLPKWSVALLMTSMILKADIPSIDERLDHVEQDLTVIRAAVPDQSHQLNRQDDLLDDHPARLTTLGSST